MDHIAPFDRRPESNGKYAELIYITKPLSETMSPGMQIADNTRGTADAHLMPGFSENSFHQRGKTLHALLLISCRALLEYIETAKFKFPLGGMGS
jgi:hypothetical protein